MENQRILQNHALILSFHRIFCRIFRINYDLTEFMRKTAITKCRTAAIREYNQADHLFETLDQFDDSDLTGCIHHDIEKKEIYVNLTRAEYLIRKKNINFSVNSYLIDALTHHPAFITNGKRFRFPGDPEVDSSGRSKQRRVWVFDMIKFA